MSVIHQCSINVSWATGKQIKSKPIRLANRNFSLVFYFDLHLSTCIDMATNPPGQAFPNKTRVAILAELEKERRRLMNTPGASISLSRPSLKEFRDNAEQQHIAAQQKAALQHAHTHSTGFFITQDSSFGNLILPVIPRLEPES